MFLDEGIKERDLIMYHYPTDTEMKWAKLKIVYLGYYIKGFSKRSNADFSIKHGMQVRKAPPEDLGDITGHEALDDDFQIINQMLKYIKLGFGKVTDQVCEEIRKGTMSREEGIELVRLYDGKCADHYIRRFCNYLKITEEYFGKSPTVLETPIFGAKTTQEIGTINTRLKNLHSIDECKQSMKIGVIDYGLGNIRSVCNAIELLGYDYLLIEKEQNLALADVLILPGVGAFEEGMNNLHKQGLVDGLTFQVIKKESLFLGFALECNCSQNYPSKKRN